MSLAGGAAAIACGIVAHRVGVYTDSKHDSVLIAPTRT